MKLTADEARDIIFDCHEDWETEEPAKTVGNNRWSVHKIGIFLHKPTDKYYKFEWSTGATEYQDEQPFQYEDEVEPTEVVKKFVTVGKWVVV